MKKISTIMVSLILAAGVLFSAGIKVNSPHPGQQVEPGKTLMIQWTKGSCTAPQVKINIFRNSIAQPNFVLQLISPNSGSKPWTVPANFTSGNYALRIKTTEKGCIGDSGVFIVKKPGGEIGIIQVEELKIPGQNENIHRHRAPAIGQPSNASFAIEKIYYDVKLGKLRNVKVMVRYTSKTAFSFNKYPGHPKDGPVYMNCKITIPDWDAWNPGPNPPVVIFNQRLSIKYGGKNNLTCDPPILNPGSGHFQLIFNPDHSGKILGLEIWKDISGAVFTTPKPCKYFYYPKLEVRLFVHTKEGIRETYKLFYLSRTEIQTKKVKGDVNLCHGGQVNW